MDESPSPASQANPSQENDAPGGTRSPSALPWVLLAAVIAVVIVAGAVVLAFFLAKPPAAEDSAPVSGAEVAPARIPPSVYACARCHAIPDPSVLPKSRWPGQLERMAALIEQYRLGVPMTAAELQEATAYYTSHAPETLDDLPPIAGPSPLGFQLGPFGAAPKMDPEKGPPVIGHVAPTDLDADGRPDVVVSDMQAGAITWIRLGDSGWTEQPLAEVVAPARTEVADLDGDGDLDVAVSALGSVGPTEEQVGRLMVLRQTSPGRFTAETVAEGLPRACDVRAVDLDGDGRTELLAATFGMYMTGGVAWVRPDPDGGWTTQWIYRRNGVSHVPTMDVDRDGRQDVVVIVSQEHEEVVALLNRGLGRFEPRVLYKAPHPMFGMSNLVLADLDGDGDRDVVFTNGDALDADPFPKPWHGVQWLENHGGGRPGEVAFEARDVGRFAGAYSAAVADLDGDGDQDIVATSMMNTWQDPSKQSIVWFENDGAEGFTPWPVGNTPTFLVTSAAVDLDGDRRLDLLVGGMNVMPGPQRPGRLAYFRNLGAAGGP
ncbi:MAG: VCBS repeat-containing protein [Acidobacteriota bacterium]